MKASACIAVVCWRSSHRALALAHSTPTRPIEIVVHTGPGGGSDVLGARHGASVEKEKLLPVRAQVANKPGGGGVVAAAYLAEKKGETHTIGIFTGVWLTNPLTSNEAKVTLKD